MTTVSFYDEINSYPSGGTLDTVFHSLKNRTHYKSMLDYDPLLKTRNGSKSDMKLITKNTTYLTYDRITQRFVGPFIMVNNNIYNKYNNTYIIISNNLNSGYGNGKLYKTIEFIK